MSSINNFTFSQLREMSNKQKEQGKNPKFITIKKKMNISHNRQNSHNDNISINLQSPIFKAQSQLISPQLSPKLSKKTIEQLISKSNNNNNQAKVGESQNSSTIPKQTKQNFNSDYNQNYIKTETNDGGDAGSVSKASRGSKVSKPLSQQQYNNNQRRLHQNLDKNISQMRLSQSQQFGQKLSQNNTQNKELSINSDMNKSQPSCHTQQDESLKNRSQLGSKQSSRMFMSPRNTGFNSSMFKSNSNFSINQTQKFESLLTKNQQYLKHLQGDCLCGKCLCGKCKCPKMMFNFESDNGFKTSYNTQFSQKQDNQRLPVIPMDFYDETKQFGNMEFRTTNKGDFIPHSVSDQKNFKQKQQYEKKPMFGGSSYQHNFINWGNYKKTQVPQKANQTVVPDLNFVGKTIYKDNFNKGDNVQKDHDLEFIKNWNKRPNYRNPDFPFQGVTTNSQAFKQFKADKQQKVKGPKNEFESLPAYKGQFQTNQQKSTTQKQVIECPSRKLLSQLYKKEVKENEKDALQYQKELKRGQ